MESRAEGIAFGPDSGEQARLRALELLDRLDEREPGRMPEPPDLAESYADDPESLNRLIELSVEHGLFDSIPAYREAIERRARKIVEEQALDRFESA
ncbi:MAG TPA: hypothetical protein VE440_04035 [Gaiellaceae bacterium]|nr:hypothetical protein [Gaiellaceae bacterium]